MSEHSLVQFTIVCCYAKLLLSCRWQGYDIVFFVMHLVRRNLQVRVDHGLGFNYNSVKRHWRSVLKRFAVLKRDTITNGLPLPFTQLIKIPSSEAPKFRWVVWSNSFDASKLTAKIFRTENKKKPDVFLKGSSVWSRFSFGLKRNINNNTFQLIQISRISVRCYSCSSLIKFISLLCCCLAREILAK